MVHISLHVFNSFWMHGEVGCHSLLNKHDTCMYGLFKPESVVRIPFEPRATLERLVSILSLNLWNTSRDVTLNYNSCDICEIYIFGMKMSHIHFWHKISLKILFLGVATIICLFVFWHKNLLDWLKKCSPSRIHLILIDVHFMDTCTDYFW